KLSTAELVAVLEEPNGWRRDKAQQMLIWQKDPAAVEPLRRLASSGRSALARLHALYTLNELGGLEAPLVIAAMKDEDAAVRRAAVALAEPLGGDKPGVIEAAAKLVGDPDPAVRLQLACSLGQWDNPEAAGALARLARSDGADLYLAA